ILDPSRALPYKDIGNGIAFAGIEYYLPLFFDQTATLFDYLPDAALTVTLGDVSTAIRQFTDDTRSRWQFLKSDRERPVLPPEALFLDEEDFFARLKPFARLSLTEGPHPDFLASPDVAVNRRAEDPLAGLRRHLHIDGRRTALCVDAAGRRETISDMLSEYSLSPDAVYDTLQDFLQA